MGFIGKQYFDYHNPYRMIRPVKKPMKTNLNRYAFALVAAIVIAVGLVLWAVSLDVVVSYGAAVALLAGMMAEYRLAPRRVLGR